MFLPAYAARQIMEDTKWLDIVISYVLNSAVKGNSYAWVSVNLENEECKMLLAALGYTVIKDDNDEYWVSWGDG